MSPLPTSDPITTEVTAITLPIEMSISPAMISSVSATAMMPRMLTTLAAVNRLSTDMKYGDSPHEHDHDRQDEQQALTLEPLGDAPRRSSCSSGRLGRLR